MIQGTCPIIVFIFFVLFKSVFGSIRQPNILLLLTDDQDVTLGSFDHMPLAKSLLQEQGVTFENAFVHTPICCPSRSTIVTGRYLHNCGVRNNSISGNCYGSSWKSEMEPSHTFAVHAKEAGYTTAYTGKYLNQYGYKEQDGVPDGWDHWLGLVGNSVYYNYTLIKGGQDVEVRRIHHRDRYPEDYLPNVMNDQVLDWITFLPEPWLVVCAWPTAHGPFTPAPWAKGTMREVFPPITGNYNASEKFMLQKHWIMRQLHPLSTETAKQIAKYYQMRLEALKSVDDGIAQILQRLDYTQQADDTVMVFTSDNGFQFGQHRLAIDKRHLYENDIRVPFCVRGPGIPANKTSTSLVANIDIAPTILDITQAKTMEQDSMDGISFWKHVRGLADPDFDSRHDILISYNGEGQDKCGMADCPPPLDGIWWMPDSYNNTYHCVRTVNPGIPEDTIYCRFEDDEDFVEFYDLKLDPFQLRNAVQSLSPVQKQRYEQRLKGLLQCRGPSCRP